MWMRFARTSLSVNPWTPYPKRREVRSGASIHLLTHIYGTEIRSCLGCVQQGPRGVPEFPLTYWKLGLMYEAMGDVDEARRTLNVMWSWSRMMRQGVKPIFT